MSRREQIVITVLVAILFATPLALMALGVRPDLDENREPTPRPELTARSATNDATWSQLGDYLTDRLPLRDRAIEIDAELRSRVNVAEAAEPGVPRGEDGWLYHADTLLDTCAGPPPADFLAAGDEVPPRAARADTEFLFAVIPDKVVVYPEHQASPGLTGPLGLDDDDGLPACTVTWVDALGGPGASRDWLWNLRGDLSDARADGEAVFFRQDTHWTDAGALVFVEGLLDRLAPGTFHPDEVHPTGLDVGRGDLARLKGLAADETQPQLEVVRPGVTVVEADLADDDKAAAKVARSRATTTGAPLVEGTTVLLGDSFTRISFRLLAPYFEELVFLQIPYLEEHTIGDALDGERADRIVVAEIQRNLAKGWYVEFIKAASHHLVHEQGGS